MSGRSLRSHSGLAAVLTAVLLMTTPAMAGAAGLSTDGAAPVATPASAAPAVAAPSATSTTGPSLSSDTQSATSTPSATTSPTTTTAQTPSTTQTTSKPTDPPSSATPAAPAKAAAVPQALPQKVGVDKTAAVNGGGKLSPGKTIIYTLNTRCSGLQSGCVNATLTDVLPAGLDVTSLPPSIPGLYTVAYDAGTRTLTVTFVQSLRTPPNTTGMADGTAQTIEVGMRLPANTGLTDGAIIPNTADFKADNSAPAQSEVATPVSVPVVVKPVTTKGWAPSSAVAQSGAATTIALGVKNQSSTSAKVTSLTVEDSAKATFNTFDFTGATLTAFPAGANRAQLLVCTAPAGTCTDADYQPGPVVSATGTLPLPADIQAPSVSAVRVRFTDNTGAVLPGPDNGVGGSVKLGMALRSSDRSTGQPIDPPKALIVNNCATTTAVNLGTPASGTSDPACTNFTVIPNVVALGNSKTFFPDTNGDYSQGAGEYAVLGQSSPVSALMTVQNKSAFPVASLTVTEPSVASANEFNKVDATSIRISLPNGATQAVLTVTCRDGSNPAPRTFTATQSLLPTGCPDTSPPSKISVTYSGTDALGNGTIATNATATLGFHGNLNAEVDNSDVPSQGNPGAGVVNCADMTISRDTRGSGTGSGTACKTLPVQLPRVSGPGVKTSSQGSVPPDQPIVFGLNLTNNGNLDLVQPGIADPQVDGAGNPAAPNPFDSLRITGVSVSKGSGTPPVTLQLFDPGAGWVAYGTDPALLARAKGVRAVVEGSLAPTQSVNLTISTLRRAGVPDDQAITNCAYTVGADGTKYPGIDPWCSPTLSTGPATASASLNKNIVPATLPRPIPGLPQQTAQVKIATANDGNLSLTRLVTTDTDTDFFDGVDFVKVDGVSFPPGADRVQLDVCTSAAACTTGTFVTGTPTASATPGLPGGVTASQVRGVRFTFTSSSAANGGYNLTPGSNLPGGGACANATACFSVTPRATLVSGGPVPATLTDTVTGGLESRLQPPGTVQPIAPNDATLTLTQGSPQLSFAKGPDSNVAPGQPAPFSLTVKNTGTANIPNLLVSDPIPDGLDFDDTWNGSTVDGQSVPYNVVVTGLPTGVDPPATVTFTPTVSGTRITAVAWDFGGWQMPPNAQVEIQFQTKLAPGAVSGRVITNKAGATSPAPGLTCQNGPTDPGFLGGQYCTDTANVTTNAGAAFNAKKWVAGNPALGWFNTVTGLPVPVGDASCPTYTPTSTSFTAYPCIALVNPGDQFDYVIQVVNAGTEAGTQMRLVDAFPAPGDTGVVLTGEQRGTQWANRPTLVTPPTLIQPPTTGGVSLVDTFTDGLVCGADLDLTGAKTCPAGSWSAAFGPSNTGVKMDLAFAPALAPAGEVDLTFSMKTPLDVPQVSNPTVAWNSFGHSEKTLKGDGSARVLPPTEPLKVGVATAYNGLKLQKAIGDNPANLPLTDLAFPFHATCGITPIGGPTQTVLDQDYEVSASTPVTVAGLPAGARCEVYEKDALGGVTDHPQGSPVVVTITPGYGETPTIQTATVTNSFPDAVLLIDKKVDGAAASFGVGPFDVQVSCTFRDQVVAGFPKVVTFNGAGEQRITGVPAGVQCSAVETATGSATSVTYVPAPNPPAKGSGTVTSVEGTPQTIAITNTFDLGNLVVAKTVSGAGDPQFSGGPFTFTAACTFNGGTFSRDITVTRDPATKTYTSTVATGPIGSECVVTETDTAGADSTPPPVTVTIGEEPAQGGPPAETVIAAFGNEFSAGTLQLEKTLTGPAAGETWATDASFAVQVTCQQEVAGVRETLFSGPVTIKGGQVLPILSAGQPLGLPVGSRCWGVESDTGGATASVVEPSSWDTASPVTVQTDPSTLQELTIAATNTFDYGSLVVNKVIDGAAAPLAASTDFSLQLTCVLPTGTGDVPILTGEKFTLRGGAGKTFDKLPVGAQCWVVEVGNGGATSTTVDHGSQADAVVVAAVGAAQATVTATNTFEAATVAVSKKVVGNGSSGPYTFTLACTLTGSDGASITVPLAAGDATFTLSSGQTHNAVAPVGATCTAAEVSPPAGATVSIVDSDASTSGGAADGMVAKVNGTATVAFTNTFPVTPPITTPPAPQPGSNAGLPGTGAQLLPAVVAGGAALLFGLALLLFSRYRRETD